MLNFRLKKKIFFLIAIISIFVISIFSDPVSAQESNLIYKFDNSVEHLYFSSLDKNLEKLSFRSLDKSEKWSEFQNVEEDHAHYGDNILSLSTTSILYFFEQEIVAIEISNPEDIDFEIKEIYTDQISKTADYSAEALYIETFYKNLGFDIVNRTEWGASINSDWNPKYQKVNRIVVHHTATSVSLSDPKSSVYAIYDYHRRRCNSNVGTAPTNCSVDATWGDIGYNYLIDPYGNIYQGREGSPGSIGAHAVPNSGSIGIGMMGTFTSQVPTNAAINSLVQLVAALELLHNIDTNFNPNGNAKIDTGMYGHRNLAATQCPGDAFYNILDDLDSSIEKHKSGLTALKAINNLSKSYSNSERNKIGGEEIIILDMDMIDPLILSYIMSNSQGFTVFNTLDNFVLLKIQQDLYQLTLTQLILTLPLANPQPYLIYSSNSNIASYMALETSTIESNIDKEKLSEEVNSEADQSFENDPESIFTGPIIVPDEILTNQKFEYDSDLDFASKMINQDIVIDNSKQNLSNTILVTIIFVTVGILAFVSYIKLKIKFK